MANSALWILRIVMALSVVAGFNNGAIAQSQRAPSAAPVMTEELMEKLIRFTRRAPATSSIDARICKVLNLCDGTKDMPVRLAKNDSTDGDHYFVVFPQADSKDVFIGVKHGAVVAAYLTDKTARLRAAAILENGVARLAPNDSVAAKFKAELTLFAKDATELPPGQ
jgi:hypothetical protein